MAYMTEIPADTKLEQCMRNCMDCYSICTQTISHCAEMGGQHVEPDHLQRLRDCALICATSVDFMLRGSPACDRICAVCAEICEDCAEDCEKFRDDDQMKKCAGACRISARACEEIAGR